MKKLNLLTIIIMLTFVSVSIAQISGTKHDFSGETWNPGGNGQICIVCHTPHNALVSPNSPLWNHGLPSETYSLYTNLISSTFDGTTTQPGGSSKLCLSCHDGTIAVDNYGDNIGSAMMSSFPGNGVIGTDLSNDHPVSFTYDADLATADGGLHDPTSRLSGLGNNIDDDMLEGGTVMQCSSCHDVHDDSNGMFLVMGNSGSALCLTCHDK